MLSPNERDRMIGYILEVTHYSKDSLLNKEDDNLLSMYKSIKNSMYDYPNDIMEYQEKLGVSRYTLEVLKSFDYHRLCSIRKEMKIEWKNINNPKKKQENHIGCNDTYCTDDSSFDDNEPLVLTPDELYIAYGIDNEYYSEYDLLKMGFVIIDKEQSNYKNSIKMELREKLIIIVNKYIPRIKVSNLDFEQLVNLYNSLTFKHHSLPTLFDMESKIKLEKRYKNGQCFK